MIPSTFAAAARVILGSDREHPADSVLRQELKAHRSFSDRDAAETSHAVFAYFRWLGWLDRTQPLEDQIRGALDLAARFRSAPESFAEADLLARAVPAWLADEMEVTSAWARSLQGEPKLWIRAKRGQGGVLAARLSGSRQFGPDALADALDYQGGEDLFRTPEFHAGDFEVQDLSSQAVGLICAPRPGESWWDACAGEGGKLLHLSELMENKGLIWASDRAGWRLQKLKRRTARARVFNYRAVLWDGGPKPPTKTRFDGVLVDAPCGGIGTWQRNPHARWSLSSGDLAELSALQGQILAHAAPSVKPGAKLVYSVCTLSRRETLGVAREFEARHPEFEPVPVANPLAPGSAPAPVCWLWPQDFGGNGMFVAVWRRRTEG